MTQTIKTGMMGAALALALGIMACSPATADAGHHKSDAMPAPTGAVGVHPISGLKVIPLAIATKGGTHQFRVEVAVTGEEQEKGLMFRTAMGADEGMIFPMDPPRMAAFWMKNTVIPLDIIFIESGGDNLAATFSPDLADLTLYVISVCQGEEIPRKGGPAITRSDFLIINKSDLAPYVNVNLDVMEADAGRMRGKRPFGFTDLSRGKGLQEVIDFIVEHGGLNAARPAA